MELESEKVEMEVRNRKAKVENGKYYIREYNTRNYWSILSGFNILDGAFECLLECGGEKAVFEVCNGTDNVFSLRVDTEEGKGLLFPDESSFALFCQPSADKIVNQWQFIQHDGCVGNIRLSEENDTFGKCSWVFGDEEGRVRMTDLSPRKMFDERAMVEFVPVALLTDS